MYSINKILAMTDVEAKALMSDPNFLREANEKLPLLQAALVAQGLVAPSVEQQKIINAAKLQRGRSEKIHKHAAVMARAIRQALGCLDSEMKEPMSGFVEKQLLSGAIYTCRQQYFWGVWNMNRAQREVSNFNLEHGHGAMLDGAEDYQQAPLRRAEALAEFHQKQCEQYELVLSALLIAWKEVDAELHKAAKAAENTINTPYLPPEVSELEKGSRFVPNIDTSVEAYTQWNEARENQYRARRQRSEQASDAANMQLLKGSSSLFDE